jgi:hypothetical protein
MLGIAGDIIDPGRCASRANRIWLVENSCITEKAAPPRGTTSSTGLS